MPGVTRKTKQKAVVKSSPVKVEKKFISESLQKKKPKKGSQKKTPKHRRRGVLYIKHLPHGFYEEQLRGYFSQFGAITRLRLARSPKTLGSKGYAFIEFRYPEVAEIAADAMNNYLMFKNIIKTRYIPPNDIKHDYFRSSVKKIKKDGEKVLTSKAVEAREAVVLNTNKLMTEDDEKIRTQKIGSKISKNKQKLATLGIDFDVDAVAQNMGEEVMESVSKATKSQALNVSASTDEANVTLDSENLDIDSDDEFDDFEYGEEDSDEDEGEEKLETALKKAREASKSAKIDETKVAAPKKEKRKAVDAKVEDAPEVPAKKTKKGKATTTKQQELPEKEKPVSAKKGKKAPAINKPAETQEVAEKTPAGKKAAKKPVSSVPIAPAKTSKRVKAQIEAAALVEKVPEQKGKGKKGKAAAPTSASPAAKPEPKKGAKKSAPVQESPQPAKAKKLAKTSTAIEKKKKPAAKVDNKKLKLAAKAATSVEGADIVNVVKPKEVKGKKKAAKK